MSQVAEFRIRETAGLRRFGYPVRARFQATVPAPLLRLLEEDKPVPAQFTALAGGAIEVDFHVNNGPFESRSYRVERGEGPKINGGLTVEDAGESFVVRYPAELEFHVPKNLVGFFSVVKTPRASYLREPSPGLLLSRADGTLDRLSAARKVTVVKPGPLAALLRFEGAGGSGVQSVVEMEFPRSKSWVEVRWIIEDPGRRVAGLVAELDLLIEERPMLVDFGAGSMVYAALRPQQDAVFRSDRLGSGEQSWQVDVAGRPYAQGTGPAEGWAHVMDRRRATAVAVKDFAADSAIQRDSIAVSPEGRLTIRREFGVGGTRTLTFWLHFVDMPVQVGAATSPQSMMGPPVVEIE